MTRVGLALALGIAAVAAADEPIALALVFPAGRPVVYSERIEGRGELVRSADGGERRLPLNALAEGRREWRVERPLQEGWELTAASTAGRMVLRLPDRTYESARPWRSFTLRVNPTGAVLDAAEVAAEGPGDDDPMPVDLDLGEILTMAELGLLPPKPLRVGEVWETPDEEGAPRRPLRVRGRLVAFEDGVATLETSLRADIPERATPLPDIVAVGALAGTLTVRFDVNQGCVRETSGPLTLELRYRRPGRAGRVLATVTLSFELRVARVEPTGRRGSAAAGVGT